jgi:hypothetical protein
MKDPKPIDFGMVAAFNKIGSPPGWSMVEWERLDDGSVVYRFGEELQPGEDGRRRWAEMRRSACVTTAERDEQVEIYERNIGLCAVCQGSGQAWCGWSIDGGNRYRECKRCGGDGKAKARAGL